MKETLIQKIEACIGTINNIEQLDVKSLLSIYEGIAIGWCANTHNKETYKKLREQYNLDEAIKALINLGVNVEKDTDGDIVAYSVASNGKLPGQEDYMLLDAEEVIELAEDFTDFVVQH